MTIRKVAAASSAPHQATRPKPWPAGEIQEDAASFAEKSFPSDLAGSPS
jgi:hypothetical protein